MSIRTLPEGTALIAHTPRLIRTVDNGKHNALRRPRIGVMAHYDASTTDAGSVAWFGDPRCGVAYQLLVLDDGTYVRIAPDDRRAWHAGWCVPSDRERMDYTDPGRAPFGDANSAFYGIAVATTDGVDVTSRQMLTTAVLIRRYFAMEGWDTEETWRVVSHRTEGAYPPGHPREGQHGRKSDPEGSDLKNPILSVENDLRPLIPRIQL